MRITKYIEDTKTKLIERFQQEQIKKQSQIAEVIPQDQLKSEDGTKETPELIDDTTGGKTPYSETESIKNFDVDQSRYTKKIMGQEIKAGAEAQAGPEIIEWGSNYIFYEDEPEKCLELFKLLCEKQYFTLCITRQHPDKFKKKCAFESEKTKVFWLSTTSCDYCLPPTLTRISHEISKAIKKNYNKIVMLDGLEFLVNHNDFLSVLKFLDSTKENVILNKSVFMVTVSPNAFSAKEISLLKKNTVGIDSSCIGFDVKPLEK